MCIHGFQAALRGPPSIVGSPLLPCVLWTLVLLLGTASASHSAWQLTPHLTLFVERAFRIDSV